MRGKIAPPLPAATVCALLLDGKRALFLLAKDRMGREEISLPCIAIMGGGGSGFCGKGGIIPRNRD